MMPPKRRILEKDWDDWDNDVMDETAIFKESLVKVKTTKEYSFGNVKLIHTQDEAINKESFRILGRNDELTADEAKIMANIIQDIYREEDEDGKDRGHQTREGNSDC